MVGCATEVKQSSKKESFAWFPRATVRVVEEEIAPQYKAVVHHMYYTSTPPATQDAGYMATNIAQRNRTLDSAWLPNIPTTILKFFR